MFLLNDDFVSDQRPSLRGLGAIHMRVLPNGWIGVGLASLYGFLMRLIRLRSGGLLAPLAGHVLTNLVIVTIVLVTAHLQ
jgi:membrane protease YdiL (CAAX protease family)